MATWRFYEESGSYHIRFRWGQPFKRALKLKDDREADRVCAAIVETIKDLKRGRLVMPADAEPGSFILSSGNLIGKPTPTVAKTKPLTLGALFSLYGDNFPEGAKAGTTLQTEGFHRTHLLRLLSTSTEVETMTLATVQGYADRRSRETWRDKPISPTTILKELATLRVIWNWGRKLGHVEQAVPFQDKDLNFARTEQKRPFETYEGIQAIIGRGGLTEEESALWECLYLTLEEVHDLLEYVKQNAYHSFIHPMFVFAAMTGARRSEICRSRIEDWRFEEGTVTIREKKRKRGRTTFRTVDMNSLLSRVMAEWKRIHPGGQYMICKDGERLTVKMATDHFKRTLSKSEKWRIIPGFHTLRHSFASILASKEVDEPTIDRWMGHQTPEQRERYRHLFPKNRKSSIEKLILSDRQ